jgi:6-phosphogluconolactonase (cycloisomerase 2 family)
LRGGAQSPSYRASALTKACPTSACIYVANAGVNVTVYPANATGNVTPYREIEVKDAKSNTTGIALDHRGRIYLSLASSTILVYAPLANGDVKPLHIIKGPKTQLFRPFDIALDSGGDIYALNLHDGYCSYDFSDVTVYSPQAKGDSPPIRTISGRKTEMHPVDEGIALDSLGNMYVTNDPGYCRGASKGKNEILAYAAGASGNVAPIWKIYGSKTTLTGPGYIAVDKKGNIYVTDALNTVKVFAAGAHGNVAPIRTISGPKTGLYSPFGISVDAKNRIYVANWEAPSITVYSAGANGNAAPIQTIMGSRTGLLEPIAIDVH